MKRLVATILLASATVASAQPTPAPGDMTPDPAEPAEVMLPDEPPALVCPPL